jgi:hypothetical protein
MKGKRHIQSFNEHQENLNISDVSDSKIIVGETYIIKEYDTKVVVIDKDDDRKRVFVTSDLVDKTGGFWINYNKLK